VVRLIRHSFGYVRRRGCDQMAKDLRPSHTAIDPDAAKDALEAFDRKWGWRLPIIGQAWRDAWEYVIPLMSFPDEVRRVITPWTKLSSEGRWLGASW
jgi:putative transposase